jgi:hypothetical protein
VPNSKGLDQLHAAAVRAGVDPLSGNALMDPPKYQGPKLPKTSFPYLAIARMFNVPYWVVLNLDCRTPHGIEAMEWLRKHARNKAHDIALAVVEVRRKDL